MLENHRTQNEEWLEKMRTENNAERKQLAEQKVESLAVRKPKVTVHLPLVIGCTRRGPSRVSNRQTGIYRKEPETGCNHEASAGTPRTLNITRSTCLICHNIIVFIGI